ncbi:MAG: SDR family NAD(P)-dependent oxidoreductase, partial [Spirochaetales bacterium]
MNLFSTELKGKAGIVTGGTSGFGLEIAKTLLKAGAKVSVFSVDDISEKQKAEWTEGFSENAIFTYQDIME